MFNMSNQKSEQEIKEEEERRRREAEKEEKEGTKEKKKEKESELKDKKNKTKPSDIIGISIPIIELGKLEIIEKEFKVEKEIPIIEKGDREVTIPIFKKEKLRVDIKIKDFDNKIPSNEIPEPEFRLIVPSVKLKNTKTVRSKGNLDDRIPQIALKRIKPLRVPKYKIGKKKKLRTKISSFDDSVDELLLKKFSRLSEIEKIEEKIKEKTMEEQVPEVSKKHKRSVPSEELLDISIVSPTESIESTGSNEEFYDKQDPLEYFLSKSFSDLKDREPFVILYKELIDDSTIGTFVTLLMKIYRQIKGGHPKLIRFNKLDEKTVREIERWIKTSDRIILLDLDQAKINNNELNLETLQDPLREMLGKIPSQDLGFIIFETKDDDIYDKMQQILIKLCDIEMEHHIHFKTIKPSKLSIEQINLLAKIAWGINISRFKSPVYPEYLDVRRITGSTLDDLFNKKGKFIHKERLKALKEEKYGLFPDVTKRHENESPLHKRVKWFLVKMLSKKYKLSELIDIKEKIKTEESYPDKKNIIPDVYIVGKKDVYEVETLFLEDAEEKITEKIDNYKETDVENINFVLDNLTLLLNIKKIIGIKKNRKKWEKVNQKRINFYTLDLHNNKLISLEEFIEEIYLFLKLEED